LKKSLSIGTLFFKLPDDFDGTAADALRLLADYMDKPTKRIHPTKAPETEADVKWIREMSWIDAHREVWEKFLDTIDHGGRVEALALSISEHNPETNNMDNLKRGERFSDDPLPKVPPPENIA